MTTDRLSGSALVLFALAVIWESRVLPLGTFRQPGPAFVPILLAWLLLIFGIFVALAGSEAPLLSSIHWSEWRHALAILGASIFSVFAIERLGYRLTVLLVLGVLVKLWSNAVDHVPAALWRSRWIFSVSSGAFYSSVLLLNLRCKRNIRTVRSRGTDVQRVGGAGLFAPRGTPASVMKTLRESVKQAVNTAEFKTAMEKIETPIAYLDAPEFQKFWDKDAKMLADAIKRVGKVEVSEGK